jgi:cyclic pyranopterin phosphate synthase
VGFISAVTHEFCGQCNRVRLTSEGYLKLCLHYNTGVDLRRPLRGGKDDEEILELIRFAISNKPDHHRFTGISDPELLEKHNMNSIGG